MSLLGCGESSDSPQPTRPADVTTGQNEDPHAVVNSGPEVEEPLAVPMLEPRPVQWLSDWQDNKPAEESKSEERVEAEQHRRFADLLKAQGNYDEAEEAYVDALGVDRDENHPDSSLVTDLGAE